MTTATRNALLWILGISVLGLGAWALTRGGDGLTVTDAWARSSPMVEGAGAAYLELHGSAQDDALVAASVPASVAGRAELHETHMSGGMASMTMVPKIDVPAGATVTLEPGGYHIMLMSLAAPLVAGDEFQIELTFESGAAISVEVEVRDG